MPVGKASMLVINEKKFLIDLIFTSDQLGKRQIFGFCCRGYLYHLKPYSAKIEKHRLGSYTTALKFWELMKAPNFKPVQSFKEEKGLRYGH